MRVLHVHRNFQPILCDRPQTTATWLSLEWRAPGPVRNLRSRHQRARAANQLHRLLLPDRTDTAQTAKKSGNVSYIDRFRCSFDKVSIWELWKLFQICKSQFLENCLWSCLQISLCRFTFVLSPRQSASFQKERTYNFQLRKILNRSKIKSIGVRAFCWKAFYVFFSMKLTNARDNPNPVLLSSSRYKVTSLLA